MLIRGNLPKLPENLENIYNLSIQQPINFAKIKGAVHVRCRQPGDTVRYGGMTRKVKKLLAEKHLPEEFRRCLPIVFDEEGILWLPGFPVRDGMTGENGEEFTVFLYSKTDSL